MNNFNVEKPTKKITIIKYKSGFFLKLVSFFICFPLLILLFRAENRGITLEINEIIDNNNQ